MFLEFFYELRRAGVPVSIHEWMALMEALGKGLHGSSLLRFYHLARACLVKHESHFDLYDRVFLKVFKGVEGAVGDEAVAQILEWLDDPKNFPDLTPEELAELERLSHDELMQRFLERLAEQTERHDGGDRWVGTGGKSPFGHNGQHPTGIRVGGQSRSRSAMKVAEDRRFKDYRTDVTLDVRQIKMSLRRLRQLTRRGEASELDLDKSIDETCRNAGEIELVFRPPRRNNVRVLLLMDVGGTMDPYFEPVSRLLSAMHEDHSLRSFEAYYFHNCVYETVFRSGQMRPEHAVPTADVLHRFDRHWKLILVGDAAMHPSELLDPYGNINPRYASATPGVTWLQRLADHFDRSVWMNPDPEPEWDRWTTTRFVRRIFPMFHLSIDGLGDALGTLVGIRRAA